MNTQKVRLAALVLAMGLSSAAQAATGYSITALGSTATDSYFSGWDSSTNSPISTSYTYTTGMDTAYGINNSGQVVGTTRLRNFDFYYYGGGFQMQPPLESYAALYSGGGVGGVSSLGTLSSGFGQPIPIAKSIAYGVNDGGQVVGFSHVGPTSDTNTVPFLYNSGGSMTSLSSADPYASYNYSSASGINNSGQIVGRIQTYDPNTGNSANYAFLYSNGSMTDIGSLGAGSDTTSANGINNSGQVVGGSYTTSNGFEHAFLYSGGSMIDIGSLDGRYSTATSINDSGQIVGRTTIVGSNNTHAFLYSNGGMIDLGALSGGDSTAYGINASGQVVGSSYILGGAQRGFLYSNGSMIDLNNLIDPLSGWTITEARDINDSGQIAANGCNTTGCFGLLLSVAAVPEPETYAMLLAGLGLVGFAARRRATMQ